mgnify:CR=1 FL=1
MFEILIGMQVDDEVLYRQYREAMLPILIDHGGYFGYDFRVSEALINPSGHSINRVFTICFPDKAASEKLFSDDKYLAVKEKFFDNAVSSWTSIAEYER